MTELWFKSVLILCISPSWIAWDFPVVPFSILGQEPKRSQSHIGLSWLHPFFSLPSSPSSPLRGRVLRSRERTRYIFRTTLQCFQLLFMEIWNCGYWKGPTLNFKQLEELGGLMISMISLSLLGFLVFLCAWSALIYTYIKIYWSGDHDGSKGEGTLNTKMHKDVRLNEEDFIDSYLTIYIAVHMKLFCVIKRVWCSLEEKATQFSHLRACWSWILKDFIADVK